MNIASIAALGGMNIQSSSKGAQVGQAVEGTFGSVFSSIVASGKAVIAPLEQQPVGEIPNSLILALLKSTTVEQFENALKQLVSKEELEVDTSSMLNSISTLGDLKELANLLDMEPKQLIESIRMLLEEEGLTESELSAIVNTNDIWFVLETIDKVAPQFFNRLTESLEGKGDLPKQSAVEVLTLLKAIELVAPKTDLLMKQEQQVFSLKSFLAVAGENFENVIKSNSPVKPGMLHVTETRQLVNLSVQTETGQSMKDDPNSKSNSELTQQAISSATGNVVVSKGEVTATELENRNNARNEALTREMQQIFKRSNFGQTGGTNRLLIKLYPEHLGQVRIELLQTNGIMTARILASTALGKEMLDSQLHQLRNAFVQQNLQVERIDVTQTLQDTSRNDRDQAFNQHFRKQEQESDNQQEQSDEAEMTFQEYMIELEA